MIADCPSAAGKTEFWHDHFGVSVPNLEAAIDWYCRILGFAEERRIDIQAIPAKIAILRNGNLRIELFEADGARQPGEERSEPNADLLTFGNKHVSFAVADVTALAFELSQRGADIVWMKRFSFGSNMFIRDNAGNLIEFVERSKPGAAPTWL